MFDRLFPTSPDKGRIITLILSFFVLRLALSVVFPVTVDEAYAIVVSRHPTLSYFDHPALGFDFARLTAWIFGSEALALMRFPHVVMGSLSALLLYRVTARAFGAEAAYCAVAWYSAAPFFFISSGHFVVPDGPLNFFLLAALWFAQPMLMDSGKAHPAWRWLLAGAALGLAVLSKYQAVLFGAGALAYLAATVDGRKLLLTRGPWLSALTACIGLVPTLVWNAQNSWVSFAFQSGRASEGLSLSPGNFFLMQAGQMAYLLPGTWAISLYMIWRGFFRSRIAGESLFAALAVVPILTFDAIALMSRGNLPHWPMSGFLFALPLTGLWCAELKGRVAAWTGQAFRAAVMLLTALALLFSLHAHTALFTRFAYDSAPELDLGWQFIAWDGLAADFKQRGILDDPDSYLLARNWAEAARAAYALGPAMPVAIPLSDPRHFAYMPEDRLKVRRKGYAVISARPGQSENAQARLRAMLAGHKARGEAWTVTETRAGFPAFEIVVIPVEPN